MGVSGGEAGEERGSRGSEGSGTSELKVNRRGVAVVGNETGG